MSNITSDQINAYRRLSAVVAIIFAGDYSLAHQSGYTGIACFGLAMMPLLFLGVASKSVTVPSIAVAVTILLSALRLVWQGNVPLVIFFLIQISLFAMAVQEVGIRFPSLGRFLVRLVPDSYRELVFGFVPRMGAVRPAPISVLSIGIPVAACALFSLFFVLANPDLAASCSQSLSRVLTSIADWVCGFSFTQLALWIGLAVFALGAMTPLIRRDEAMPTMVVQDTNQANSSMWYFPVRNTLYAVNGLFIIYLGFELVTIWFGEFPEGFHYSGYAHQGAIWLTIALATTTATLSWMFQCSFIADPRIRRLRNLAWLWSGLNLLLAISVYHRLWIYVDFNGMTRMRMVGFFGITCVVAGLGLCAYKIYGDRSFRWLVESQAWAFTITLYILAITPTDWLCHQYNVRRILDGYLPPIVQVTSHPVSPEGWLVVRSLVQSDNPIIRKGIIATMMDGGFYPDDVRNDSMYLHRIGPSNNWRRFQWSEKSLRSSSLSIGSSESLDKETQAIIEQFSASESDRKEAIHTLYQFAYKYY